MTKKNRTPIKIFTEATKLYFSNFTQFFKYMSFPVWGQVLGLIITFTCTLVYAKNLPLLIEKYKFFNDFNTLVLISAAVALPGLIVFMKAFWEYLVAYGAVNSMLENMLKSGKVYDFNAHTELIKRRTFHFVILWLLLGIFSLAASFPLFWVPAGVIAIYLVLVFQVFTFEPDLSPIKCIKKSVNLIKGHFASTFFLVALSGLICWIGIPHLFNYLFDITGTNKLLTTIVLPFAEIIPTSELNGFLAQFQIPIIKDYDVALFIVTSTIAQILIQYTLPFRSLLCGLWYKELNDSASTQTTHKKSSKKRPSEKLMEESHKKFNPTKKLDKNILKRAMEKEE